MRRTLCVLLERKKTETVLEINTMKKRVCALFLVDLITIVCSVVTYADVTIIVNKGLFDSVEDAANGENAVDWLDRDQADDSACTESFAAIELAQFLPKCFSIAPEQIKLSGVLAMPSQGDVFLLGSVKSNRLIAERISEVPDFKTNQSYCVKSFREDNRTITIIQGSGRIGTLYGVYEYLKINGIKFYGLGETGTVYPASKSDALPLSIEWMQTPDFLTRGFWLEGGILADKDFYRWMVRNKLNFWPASDPKIHLLKKLGAKCTAGGHHIMDECLNPNDGYPYNHINFTGDDDLPEDAWPVSDQYLGDEDNDGKLSYYEAHPEWFGLISGKRSRHLEGTAGDNYCTTNEEATHQLAKNIIISLKEGKYKYVDILNVWLLDNGKWCECDNCAKLKSRTDKLFNIMYVILKEMNNARKSGYLEREVVISMCAYHETLPAPTVPLPEDFDYDHFMITFFPIERCYVHCLSDSACTEINAYLNDFYMAWVQGDSRTYKGQVCVGEYYNVSSIMSLPAVFPEMMAADIPWYYKTGSRHFCYMHSPLKLWGTWTLNQSLLAALTWDTSVDTDAFLKDYFSLYYPTTSQYARRYYKLLENASSNIKALKHYVGTEYGEKPVRTTVRGRLTDFSQELFPLKHLQYDKVDNAMNDGPDITQMMDWMTQAGFEMEAALLACDNETEQARLLEDYNRYEYGMAMYRFYYHIIRTSIFQRKGSSVLAKNEFQRVVRYKEALERITDVPFSKSGGVARNGYEATQCENHFDYFDKLYGPGN